MPNPCALPAPSTDNQSILSYVLSLFENDDAYFGVITLAVQHGRIIHVLKEQNLKATEILSLKASDSGNTYAQFNKR